MGALGIDPWGLAVQIVAFLIFIYLFWRYALGPITNMLDERSQRIADSMAAAENMRREMAAASARNEEILADGRVATYLVNPSVTADRKLTTLESALDTNVQPETRNLAKMLIDRNRT